MRNMSFALTTPQMRARMKTVTRRLGWLFLKEDELVKACVKCMGLRPGETISKICVIRVLSVRIEPLDTMEKRVAYGMKEATLEGFPHLTGKGFVDMFVEHMRCQRDHDVTRIAFEFID